LSFTTIPFTETLLGLFTLPEIFFTIFSYYEYFLKFLVILQLFGSWEAIFSHFLLALPLSQGLKILLGGILGKDKAIAGV
jgi:hypothetical protein